MDLVEELLPTSWNPSFAGRGAFFALTRVGFEASKDAFCHGHHGISA